MRQKGWHFAKMFANLTTDAQQGCQHEFARDENPLSTTYALDCKP